MLNYVLPSLTTTPFFATRPVLTALVLALLARFTDWISTAPDWLTATPVLIGLAVLALVEVLAAKNDELRVVLNEFDPLLKAGLNFVLAYILVEPVMNEWSGEMMMASSGVGVGIIGSGLGLLWAAFTTGSVWILAAIRRNIWRFFTEFDEGDDLGAQGVLSWVEDLWVVMGTFVAVVFPLLSIFIYLATLVGLFVLQKALEQLAERRKEPCANCGTLLHGSALICFACGYPNRNARQVGLLGQARRSLVVDPVHHQHNLRSRKRCPVCATRLPRRTVQQTCPACGAVTFANAAELNTYLGTLRADLPRVLAVCFAVGLIPILGIVLGVIYYQLSLIASLRSYVPRTVGCLARAAVAVINLLLVMVQWVPLLGAFTVPLMALTNYAVYRALIQREREKTFQPSTNTVADAERSSSALPTAPRDSTE